MLLRRFDRDMNYFRYRFEGFLIIKPANKEIRWFRFTFNENEPQTCILSCSTFFYRFIHRASFIVAYGDVTSNVFFEHHPIIVSPPCELKIPWSDWGELVLIVKTFYAWNDFEHAISLYQSHDDRMEKFASTMLITVNFQTCLDWKLSQWLIKRISYLINKICFHNRNRKNFPRATHESISPKMKLKSLLIELVKCRNWKVARCWHLQSLPRLGKFELARKWDKLPTGKSRDGKLKFSSQFRTWNHFRNIFLNRAAGRSKEKFSNGRKTFANSLCELKLCQKCREFNHREQSPLRILIAKSIMCRTRSNWWNSRKIPKRFLPFTESKSLSLRNSLL